MRVARRPQAALPRTEGWRRSLCLWGLSAPGRCLLARRTDPHLLTPRRRLHQDRGRIEAVLANTPDEPRGGALGYTLVEGRGQGRADAGRLSRGRGPLG
jgi:hypothetical protein